MLAFANGANDNSKGVATLVGSGSASYRRAIRWAGLTTLVGSITAFFLAGALLAAFSGKGLVPPHVVADVRFPTAVALAGAGTVMLATSLGLPISTTHALMGSILGAGWVAAPADVSPAKLGASFIIPLAASPVIAAAISVALYPCLVVVRRGLGIEHDSCACIGAAPLMPRLAARDAHPATTALAAPSVLIGSEAACRTSYTGRVMGINAGTMLDAAHYVSAGVVSFARGLNDTPKIAALLLAGELLTPGTAIVGVAAAMVLGGLLAARRVADTMSLRITSMNSGQGFTANVVTGVIVVGASTMGLPVSTTHVSCGALFGIGAVTRGARWRVIREVLMAWVVTLPVAAALGGLAMWAL